MTETKSAGFLEGFTEGFSDMTKAANHLIATVVRFIIMIGLIFPPSLFEDTHVFGVQTAHAAELHQSTGIFRTLVYIPDEGSRLRLDRSNARILRSGEWTMVLVTSVQMEELVKSGLKVKSSVDLGVLTATNFKEKSSVLSEFNSDIEQASALWADVDKSLENGFSIYLNKSMSASLELAEIIDGFSEIQLNTIANFISSDSDGDGLTDTEERWWCTDPYHPYSDPDGISDGNEVTQLLAGNNADGKPFIGWPSDHVGCYDDDYDSIPDLAEIRVIGLNPNRESTDGDKFDDGQEFFGITKYPSYGALPRAEDTFITSSMPGWVDPPGNSPFVAAYPKIHFEIIESSIDIELVTQITTGESHSVGESFSYATTNTNGTSTGVGKEESHTYSRWQEVGNSIADGIERSTYQSRMNSYYQEYSYEHSVGVSLDIEYGQSSSKTHETHWTAGLGATFGSESSVELGLKASLVELAGVTVGGSSSRSISPSIEGGISDSETKGESWAARLGTSQQTTYGQTSGYEVGYETGTSLSASQVHERSQNIGSGYESGQSTTITREDYSEIAVTNENQIATSQEWSTATAVNTNHAADLTFGYRIHNTGTDSARQINNILFNIYIEGTRNPITTYAAVLQGDTCAQVSVANFYPGSTFPANGTMTHCNIPLSLEQLALIDQGAKMRVVVADYSYGDDQQFYENAWAQGVIVEVDDGTADGDESIDSYLIPTWGNETYQDVIRRYFPVTETAQGDILSTFTPEYDSNHRITSWNEHAIGGYSWWNIYLSDYGDGYFVPFRERAATPETHVLMRFNQDTDRDFFSDRAERSKNTSITDPKNHPNAVVFAGYYEEREGNTVKVQMALENLGNFDAIGVQAMMFAFDDTITVESSLVGMAGLIPSGNKVLLTSKILNPKPLAWSGTAQPVVSGHYTGNQDNLFTFTVGAGGQIGVTPGLNLNWTDQYGNSGSIAIGSGYLPPSAILVKDGISIGMGSGLVTAGNRFEIEVLAPRDVFEYTINQEPYTEPLIIVSYNDPQGNKRFATSVHLTSIHEDLWSHADQMLPVPELTIMSEQEFQPGVDNTIVYSIVNPLNTAIEDGYLWIAYAESLTGDVVLTKVVETSFLPGPNLFADTWSTNDFTPGYEPDKLYKVKVFATDREYRPFDVAFSQFTDLGNSRTARFSTTALSMDLGEISKGEVRRIPFSYANTGFSNLWIGISQSSPIKFLPEPIIQNLQPGATSSIGLVFDTSDLPIGPFTQVLPIRTNDPSKPYINLTLTGSIISPDDDVTSYMHDEYRPWSEYIYVLGPQSENATLSYSSTLQSSPDIQPIFLLDEQDDLVGKSDVIVNAVGSQTVLYSAQGQFPQEYIQAAKDEGRDISDAMELLEYRTPYSHVYVWPDGYGMAISEIVDSPDLVTTSSSSCTANADGYVHWYYSGNYPQFGQTHMYVGNYLYFYKERARSYIKFCLPSLPSYNSVNSATMYLYMYSPNGTNMITTHVYQVTSGWSESSPFHASNQPGLSGPVATRDINKEPDWKTWDLTSLVRNWYGGTPNYGVMLAASPENSNGMAFYTRENGSNRPFLSVSFTLNVPATPTLFSISNTNNIGDYSVSWSSVPNTLSYKLFEQKDGGSWSNVYAGSGTSNNRIGRAAGTWCYKVQAINSAGSSADSNIQCTTVKPTSAPVLADILNNGEGTYTVSWSSVPGALSYVLEEGLNANNWNSLYSGTALSHSIIGRTSGNWCYRIKAVNSGGSTEWSSTKCAIVNTAPNIPDNLSPTDGAQKLGRSIVFSWQDTGDTDNAPRSYREFSIRVFNLDNGWSFTSDLVQGTSWQITLPDDGRYQWQIRSYDGLGYSDWSSEQVFSVYSVANTAPGQVTISLPSSIANHKRFNVQYGIPIDITVPDQSEIVSFGITKRTYLDVRLDIVLANSESPSPTVKIDIGSDGQDILTQELVWSGTPAAFGSMNIAPMLNNYLSQSSAEFGLIEEIPVSVSLDTVGEIILTNLVLTPGVDKDLSVINADISLDVLTPTEGMEVVVQADIQNIGYLESGPVSISYYAELSDGSVEHIGSDFIANITASQTISSQVLWKTLGFVGSVPVTVVIDPNEDINEASKANNQAEKEFHILTRPDLHIVSMRFSNEEPVVGETITIPFDVENLGETQSLPSALVLSSKGTIANQNNVAVLGGSISQTALEWTPSEPGLHRLVGITDYTNTINESNENNNQIWKDIYVGFADRILIDSGDNTDELYSTEKGYGFLDPNSEASNFCGAAPTQTHRKDNDGDINYRFDHLLPGHFYHLNIVFYECDGLARQQSIMVDDTTVVDAIDLGNGNVHQISLRLDPALYADHSIDVKMKELTGYDVIVSEINLIDIDYRYADSGGLFDPAYPSNTKLKYGWLDGEKNIPWGVLPHQTRRLDLADSNPSDDPDNEMRYRFDGLRATDNYKLSFVFYQQSTSSVFQEILVDGQQVGSVTLDGTQRKDLEFSVPSDVYQVDGTIIVTIRRPGSLSGAFVNEIALEQVTIGGGVPTVRSVSRTGANPTNSETVDFLVVFSENVIGVDVTDFRLNTSGDLSNAYVISVDGSNHVYTVTVNTGAGNGTIRLDVLDDDSIQSGDGTSLAVGFVNGESFTIDKIPPDSNIISQPVNPSNQTLATFTFSSPDISAIFECRLDGGSYASCTSPKTYTGLIEGSHTFEVRARDAAGNIDSSPASFSWVIDKTPPDTKLDSHPANLSNQASATFTFSSPDISATFECRLDGGSYAACASPKSYSGLTEGSHTVFVRARDTAGNIDSSPASFSWVIDKTPPDTKLDSHPANLSNQASATFTFSSPDISATFECRLDGGSYTACTSPKTYSGLAEGSRTFDVRARDAAGNIDPSPAVYAWTIDTTLPEVTDFSADSPSGSFEIAIKSFVAFDSMGITGYLITQSPEQPSLDHSGWSISVPAIFSVDRNGTYTLYPWARDSSGNISVVFSSPVQVVVDVKTKILFDKISPINDVTDIPLSSTLTWEAGTGADEYEYCLDTSDNNACDANWISTGDATSVSLSGLAADTTYHWQVRAFDDGISNEADNGIWWSFTTIGTTTPPAAFGKSSPTNGTVNLALPPTLAWEASSGATGYEYCIDTTNDNACSAWIDNGTATSVLLSGLTPNTTYYWQVRASNETGTTYANGSSSAFWSLTTKEPTATFADVPVTYWAWSYIERLYAAGITGGCANNPLRYCPDNTVTRGQMAIFLLKGIHGSDYTPPAVGDSTGFADVPTTYWAAAWIKQLAAEGITGGCGSGNYCPDKPVTRAQMAVFLLKAKYGNAYTPPPLGDGSGFADVPASNPFAPWIKQLAAEKITGGCGGGNYCPNNAVTRAQMAVFLVKAFGLP